MIRWLEELQQLMERDERCVLVTVAGARGSTPREIGAKMIVTATETIGTIGGGQLEYQCVKAACKWLQQDAGVSTRSRVQRFTLGANCGQCCGGVAEILFEEMAPSRSAWVARLAELHAADTAAVMVTARQSRAAASKLIVTARDRFAFADGLEPTDAVLAAAREALQIGSAAKQSLLAVARNVELPVLIEPVLKTDFHIMLFGAGHVGTACAGVFSMLDVRVDLIDSRPGFADAGHPGNIRAVECADPALAVDTAPPGSYYLVMTHDHALDFEICARVLRRHDAAYCGLIGSRSKRRRFEKRFRALGLSESEISGLTCPIGIDAISGKKPAEIAIAVAAQLLQLHERAAVAGFETNIVQHALAISGNSRGGKHD